MLKRVASFVLFICCFPIYAADFDIVNSYLNRGLEKHAVSAAIQLASRETKDYRVHEFLGDVYLTGKYGQDYHLQKSIEYFEQAAKLGSAPANLELGLIFTNSYYIETDCKLGISYLNEAIEMGSIEAQAIMAENYAYGYCVEQNYEIAIDLLQKPYEHGNMVALAVLGTMNFYGEGVPEDTDNAIMMWQQAAEMGHCDSQYNLGAVYDNGVGVDVDLKKAFEIFQQAADGGCIDSKVALAHMYYLGRYVKQDDDFAFKLYQEAYEMGDIEAQAELAQMMLRGDGTEVDVEKGKSLLIHAAQSGFDRAQTKLAELYFKGRHIEQSYELAYQWYSKAAESDPFAQAGLGYLLEFGLHGTQDTESAATYYELAIKQGNVDGVVALARMYMTGTFYQKDEGKALALLQNWKGTNNDRILGTLVNLLACAEDSQIRNQSKAFELLQEHQAMNETYHFEVDLGMAALHISNHEFDKALQVLKGIESIILDAENKYRMIENHFASDRYKYLLHLANHSKACVTPTML